MASIAWLNDGVNSGYVQPTGGTVTSPPGSLSRRNARSILFLGFPLPLVHEIGGDT